MIQLINLFCLIILVIKAYMGQMLLFSASVGSDSWYFIPWIFYIYVLRIFFPGTLSLSFSWVKFAFFLVFNFRCLSRTQNDQIIGLSALIWVFSWCYWLLLHSSFLSSITIKMDAGYHWKLLGNSGWKRTLMWSIYFRIMFFFSKVIS